MLCDAKRQLKILHTDCVGCTQHCGQPVRSKDHTREKKAQRIESIPFLDIMDNVTKTVRHCHFKVEELTQSDLSVH